MAYRPAAAGQLAQGDVEHRRQEQAEQGDADHAGEHRRAQCLAHFGAGAEVRQALGTAVFAGMIGVTLFGLFLTPVFYVALRKLAGGGRPVSHHGSTMDGEAHGQTSGDTHA